MMAKSREWERLNFLPTFMYIDSLVQNLHKACFMGKNYKKAKKKTPKNKNKKKQKKNVLFNNQFLLIIFIVVLRISLA